MLAVNWVFGVGVEWGGGNGVAFAASTLWASARCVRIIMLYCHHWLNWGREFSRIREELHGAKTGAHPALIGRSRLCSTAVAAPAALKFVVCARSRAPPVFYASNARSLTLYTG